MYLTGGFESRMDSNIADRLRSGCVIPAHPLVLDNYRQIDIPRQKALTHYYLSAGAGGLAVGVHTTQFSIHYPQVGLLRPVLELAAQTVEESVQKIGQRQPILIAGIVGSTDQAVREAQLAKELGYHIGLLSMAALKEQNIARWLEHAREVATIIPIMGFYLQQSISRMVLPMEFWRGLVDIPNLVAIKIAPFHRYQTLDVLEAVAYSGRSDQIALYSGNDDSILVDLMTRYEFIVNGHPVSLRIVGGLLGQWAYWTRRAVEYIDAIHELCRNNKPIPSWMLTLATQITLENKAIFDADNNFSGCIPGILCVLKHQGFVRDIVVLDSNEKLSASQIHAIDKIIKEYPHLTDDEFVKENISDWISG
jgi:dihydrodipicolinate synthase/N-acetylneuraminate lyase